MVRPEHIVVVGAGLGGTRTAEQLRAVGYDGRISLIGAEQHQPYDRPPLSKQVLSGAWPPERAALHGADALDRLRVEIHLGCPATALHPGAVELADGTTLAADAVVVATGADARRLPEQPVAVHTLRTLDDSLALRAALVRARSLLVVGGGFIGAEVASGAVGQGVKVTVLEALPVPFERALGAEVGALCGRLLSDAGVDLRLNARLARFVDDRVVELADGERVSADVVLVGVGAVPAVGWLANSAFGRGLDTADGLACDTRGRVLGAPGVWAVGDAAAWQDPVRGKRHRSEHWTSATEQAAAVARDILGADQRPAVPPYFWSDQFGLKIQLIGWPELADGVLPLGGDGLASGAVRGTLAGYFAGDRLVAVVGFGAARQIARSRALVAHGASLAEVRTLIR